MGIGIETAAAGRSGIETGERPDDQQLGALDLTGSDAAGLAHLAGGGEFCSTSASLIASRSSTMKRLLWNRAVVTRSRMPPTTFSL